MRPRYFFIILIFIVIFLGCGGGDGGVGTSIGPSLRMSRVSGRLIFDETLYFERAYIANNTEAVRAAGYTQAVIFLEEMPTRAVYPDSDGNFSITDLPLNISFHLIARINSLTGKVYKTRSEAFTLSSSNSELTKNLQVGASDEAKYQIRLEVKDTSDNPVGRSNIWLWGEEFTLDESGCYLSPKMPYGAKGILKVVPPAARELGTLECEIDSQSFKSDILGVSSVTLLPKGITYKKAPVAAITVGELMAGGSTIRLFGSASDPQGDQLELEWQTNVGSFTYTSFDKSYVDWTFPSDEANVIITLKAKQVLSSLYPYLSTSVDLPVKISKNGQLSFPGRIIDIPITRSVEIVSSATTQITGNTMAYYEAVASFPETELPLHYFWTISDGNFVNTTATNRRICWNSPLLKIGEIKTATMTVEVSDGIGTASQQLSISITAFPTITIPLPIESEFLPGILTFSGAARDFRGISINPEYFSWYVASDTDSFKLLQTGSASFTYDFSVKGTYTIVLEAIDSNNCVGTFSRQIKILNIPPEVEIISPHNDSGFRGGEEIPFYVSVIDDEEGKITSQDRITWYSDIDEKIGTGHYFETASLSQGMHTITVIASDSEGAIGSASIIVWYDMPARIMIEPKDGSGFFAGSPINFVANGFDVDNQPLDAASYMWYLDDFTAPWKSGVGSFTLSELSSGTHTLMVSGKTRLDEEVNSAKVVFDTGLPLAKITSPASGIKLDPAESSVFTFTAIPAATGTMEFQWLVDNSPAPNGSGNILNTTLDWGRHVISYVGTDSAGIMASDSIEVIVEGKPIVSFKPEDSVFFKNREIAFQADCRDVTGKPMPDSAIKWYLLDSGSPVLWKSGNSFAVGQGNTGDVLRPGEHIVMLEATSEYGTVATLSHKIITGIDIPIINKPINYSSFNKDDDIEFVGVPDSEYMPIQWYINEEAVSNEASFIKKMTTEGSYNIKLVATDSTGIAMVSSVVISVGQYPIIDFTLKANGKEIDPTDAVLFTGQPITLIGSGIDPVTGDNITGKNMTWYIYEDNGNPKVVGDGDGHYQEITISASDIAKFGPGYRNIELSATNSVGASASKKKSVYLNLPLASIASPTQNQIIPVDSDNTQSIAFTASATPNNLSTVVFNWYNNWPSQTLIFDTETHSSTGNNIRVKLPTGMQYISYVATDSVGMVSSDTRKVIVSNSEELDFIPANGGSLFANRDITLDISSGIIDMPSVDWFANVDGTEVVLGKSAPFTLTADIVSSWPRGYVNITASAVNSIELGVNSKHTNKLYYGLKEAEILSPADNMVFPIGSIQNFVASPTAESSYAVRANMSSWLCDDVLISEFDNKPTLQYCATPGRHVISYIATDSAQNFTTAKINVLFDNPPVITFAPPEDEISPAYIFAGGTFDIIASGVGVVDSSVPLSDYKWYINRDYSSPKMTGDSAHVTASILSEGENFVEVSAQDEFGVVGTGSHIIYYGEPLAQISSPYNDQRFDDESEIVLNGNVSPNIEMVWYLNGSLLGSGDTFTVMSDNPALVKGRNTVTYIGTDSANLSSKATVDFLYSNLPQVAIKTKLETEAEGSVYFSVAGTGNITFNGTATDTVSGQSIAASKMTWKLYIGEGSGGTELTAYRKTNTNNPNYNSTVFSEGAGTYTVTLTAVDQLGLENTKEARFYYGHTPPSIISPVDGAEFKSSENHINFVGSADSNSHIDMCWIRSDSGVFATGNTAEDDFPIGNYEITYIGTDSAGVSKSDSINILVNDKPTVNILTASSNQPANNTVYFGMANGENIGFKGNGQSADGVAISSMTWKLYSGSGTSGTLKNTQSGVSAVSYTHSNFGNVGTFTIALIGEDSLGTQETTLAEIYYGHVSPIILSPADGTNYDYSGSNISVDFTGNKDTDSYIPFKWYSNDGSALNQIGSGDTCSNYYGLGSYTVTYTGTDSAARTKTAVIHILIDQAPTINMALNNGKALQNAVFFPLSSGDKIVVKGSGTGGIDGLDIPASNMSWSLYSGTVTTGTPKKTFNAVNQVELGTGELNSVGTYTLCLTAKDSFNYPKTISQSFYYGFPVPSITTPTNNKTFSISEGNFIYFQGSDFAGATLNRAWFASNGTTLGIGSSVYGTFSRGNYTVTYIGTDTAGIEKSATVNFVVNDAPTVSITSPYSGGYFFGGQSIFFSGSANKSQGSGAITGTNLIWSLGTDGVNFGTSLGTGASLNVTDMNKIGTGTRYIRLSAVDNDFTPALTASATIKIITGVGLPTITLPASGTRFDTGSDVTFVGNSLPVPMSWTSDDSRLSGTGSSINSSALTRGYRKITYKGIDSTGTEKEAVINILIDKIPTFDSGFPKIANPAKVWDGMQKPDGSYYPVFLLTSGPTINLQVSGKDEANASIASITWFNGNSKLDGSTETPWDFNFNSEPGSYTYRVVIEDSYGVQNEAIYSFWLWNCEKYTGSFNKPKALINYNDNIFVTSIGEDDKHNQICKLTRNSSASPAGSSGDIVLATSTIIASCTPGYEYSNLNMSSSTLMSLATNGTGGVITQKWDVNNLNTNPANDFNAFNGGLQVVNGFTFDSNTYYISDYTNNRLAIFNGIDGTLEMASSIALPNPFGVKKSGEYYYLACKGNNHVYKFTSSLNVAASWQLNTVTEPTEIVCSNANVNGKTIVYVTSDTQKKIYALDSSNGNVLYSFGLDGTDAAHGQFKEPYGIAICGSGKLADLYIADPTNNCIVRFRNGVGW